MKSNGKGINCFFNDITLNLVIEWFLVICQNFLIRLILKYYNHPSVITEKIMDETGFLKVPGTMQLPKY